MTIALNTIKALLCLLMALALVLVLLWVTIGWTGSNVPKILLGSIIELQTDYRITRLDDLQIDVGLPAQVAFSNIEIDAQTTSPAVSHLVAERIVIRFDPFSWLGSQRPYIEYLEMDAARIVAVQKGAEDKQARADANPYISSIRITNTDIQINAANKSDTGIGGHVALLELDSAGIDQPMKLNMEGMLAEIPVQIKGRLGSMQMLDSGQMPFPVDLNISAGTDHLSVKGEWPQDISQNAFELSVNAEGSQFNEIARALGVSLATVPPYKASFTASGSEGQIAVDDLKITLGYSYIYGTAALDAGQMGATLSADLGASLIRQEDVEGLFPPYELDQSVLDIEIPHLNVADIRLSVSEYQGRDLVTLFNSFKINARLKDNILTFGLDEATLADGIVEGRVLMVDRASTVDTAMQLNVNALQLPELISAYLTPRKRTEVKPLKNIAGSITTSTNLRGSGDSPQTLVPELRGEMGVAMEQGAITKEAIEAIGVQLTKQAETWLGRTSMNDFNCALGLFDVDGGVIKSKALVLASDDAIIIGSGKIDLNNEFLDLTFEAHMEDFSFPAMQSPVRVKGSFAHIGVEVMEQELVAKLEGAALKTTLEATVAQLHRLESSMAKAGQCQALASSLKRMRYDEGREIGFLFRR